MTDSSSNRSIFASFKNAVFKFFNIYKKTGFLSILNFKSVPKSSLEIENAFLLGRTEISLSLLRTHILALVR